VKPFEKRNLSLLRAETLRLKFVSLALRQDGVLSLSLSLSLSLTHKHAHTRARANTHTPHAHAIAPSPACTRCLCLACTVVNADNMRAQKQREDEAASRHVLVSCLPCNVLSRRSLLSWRWTTRIANATSATSRHHPSSGTFSTASMSDATATESVCRTRCQCIQCRCQLGSSSK